MIEANLVSIGEQIVTGQKGGSLFFFLPLFGDVPAEEVHGSDVAVFLGLTGNRVDKRSDVFLVGDLEDEGFADGFEMVVGRRDRLQDERDGEVVEVFGETFRVFDFLLGLLLEPDVEAF